MKLLTLIGIILIVLGGFALAYGGFTYVTRETVLDVGPVKVQADRERTFPLPPIIGAVAVAAWAALTVIGARQNPA